MPRAKLDWTPVNIAGSSRAVQTAYDNYQKSRAALEQVVAAALAKQPNMVPKGHVVKIGLMFNNVSFAIVPEGSTSSGKAMTL